MMQSWWKNGGRLHLKIIYDCAAGTEHFPGAGARKFSASAPVGTLFALVNVSTEGEQKDNEEVRTVEREERGRGSN